jgi:hypothetical protein
MAYVSKFDHQRWKTNDGARLVSNADQLVSCPLLIAALIVGTPLLQRTIEQALRLLQDQFNSSSRKDE